MLMRYISIMIIVFLLAGCGGGSSVVIETDVYSGTEGLRMRWLDNSPPADIPENQAFPMGVELSNEGAHDIVDGYLTLIYEQDYIDIERWEGLSTMSENTAYINLQGRSKLVSVGDRDTAIIYMESGELEAMTETHTVFTSLTACYEYMTYFGESVCIDAEQYTTKDIEKTCEVQPLSFSGQGAPVAVTRVEPTMYFDSGRINPRFKITVANVGDGEVIHPQRTADACSAGGLTKDDLNHVVIHAKLAENDLRCVPDPVILRDGVGTSMCEVGSGLEPSGTYSSLLTVELEYGYTTTISGTTEIRKIT
jgi:hypothetical protein